MSLGSHALDAYLVGQGRLDTSVSSQSGTLGALGLVVLNISPYSFVWACEIEIPGTIDHYVSMIALAPLVPDADAPQIGIVNADNNAQNYAAEWRHVNP